MKRAVMLIAVAGLLLSVAGTGALAGESQTLTGEYHWTQRDNKGPLEAVFTATGENTWDVSFNFEFRGQARTYSGTAEGSLTDGKLKGTVKNEDKRRTFEFDGTFEDGAFSGSHNELEDGRKVQTGTLKLKV